MPFPQPFIKVVASGILFGGAEIFSTSWSLADPDLSNDAEQPSDGVVDNIALAVTEWFSSPQAHIQNWSRLLSVKVNLVGVDGLYLDKEQTIERAYLDEQVFGGADNELLPSQCSVAISMRSNRVRGPGAFGRFYPPLNAGRVEPDGRLPIILVQEHADSAALFLDKLNLAAGGVLKVVNASQVGSGTFQRVTRVGVGRVVDTIRKRRSALDEDYQYSDVRDPIGPG
uniref:Uncharacterized protein n=1 Tax=uncultured prokaryote TaxID=198431 RepID=A0A0H5Q3L5_9ZZZZ|nr:hypothetical protein [uncultured prokaryote]